MACLALALISCLVAITDFQDHVQQKTTFELRRAEREMAPGLIEARIEKTEEKVYLHSEVLASNDDIVKARVISSYSHGFFDVEIEFRSEAAERVGKASGEHITRPFAIIVNGSVISAPVVQSKFSNMAVISGAFTRKDAEELAQSLKGRL